MAALASPSHCGGMCKLAVKLWSVKCKLAVNLYPSIDVSSRARPGQVKRKQLTDQCRFIKMDGALKSTQTMNCKENIGCVVMQCAAHKIHCAVFKG